MRIFTKKFFRLSRLDQTAVVNAAIRDLTDQHYVNAEDERKAREEVQRIAKKAHHLGIPVQC